MECPGFDFTATGDLECQCGTGNQSFGIGAGNKSQLPDNTGPVLGYFPEGGFPVFTESDGMVGIVEQGSGLLFPKPFLYVFLGNESLGSDSTVAVGVKDFAEKRYSGFILKRIFLLVRFPLNK